MAFAADRLARLDVTAPAHRLVALPSRYADLKDIRFAAGGRRVGHLMAAVAGRFAEVRAVPEIVLSEGRAKARAV